MSIRAMILLVVISCFPLGLNAQQDSIIIGLKKNKTFLQKSILPASLIISGSFIYGSDFEKSFQKDVRNVVGNHFYAGVDDYTRYVPIIEMYAADAFEVSAKNHWFDQTKNLIIANMVSDFITFKLKKWTQKRRPNDGDSHSFPSGHTTFAFTNASVLFHEFNNSSPVLAYSGYAFAATTGAFRVMNNAHWISDVLVGAGIGIIITELVYELDPIIKWNPFKKTKGISFIPLIDNGHYGFYFSKTL